MPFFSFLVTFTKIVLRPRATEHQRPSALRQSPSESSIQTTKPEFVLEPFTSTLKHVADPKAASRREPMGYLEGANMAVQAQG
jgi:hypothetical protein